MAVSDFRKRLDEDLKKQGKKQGESNPTTTDEYDLANRFSTAKKTIAPSVSRDLYNSAENIHGKLVNNIYKLGGSERIKKYGMFNAADPMINEAQYYKKLYQANPQFFKQYFGEDTDWERYFTDFKEYDGERTDYFVGMSDATVDLLKETKNIATARTGGLDSIDMTGMPRAQKQELGYMDNLYGFDLAPGQLGTSLPEDSDVKRAGVDTYQDLHSKQMAYSKKQVKKDLKTLDTRFGLLYAYPNTQFSAEADKEFNEAAGRLSDYYGIDLSTMPADFSGDWTKRMLAKYDADTESLRGVVPEYDNYAEYDQAHARKAEQEEMAAAKGLQFKGEASALEAASKNIEGYEDKSKYIPSKAYWHPSHADFNILTGNSMPEEGDYTSWEDRSERVTYSFLNDYIGTSEALAKNPNDAAAQKKLAEMDKVAANIPNLMRYDLRSLPYMDDAQRETFYRYYKSGDYAAVDEYLGKINYDVAKKAFEAEETAHAADLADNTWGENVLNWATSIPRNVLASWSNFAQMGNQWLDYLGVDINQDYNHEYNEAWMTGKKVDMDRAALGQQITNATSGITIPENVPIIGGKNAANLGYQALTSIADLVASRHMGGNAFTSWTMFGREGGDTMREAMIQGNPNAVLYGTGAGAWSALVEYFGGDELAASNFLKAANGEGVEELVTGAGQTIWDLIVNGKDSSIMRTYDEYVRKGYGDNAKWATAEDTASDSLEQYLVGFGAGGAPAAVNAAVQGVENRKNGVNLLTNEAQYDLADLAETVGVDGQAADIMRRLRAERADKTKGDKAETEIAEKGGVTKADAEASAREAEMTERDKAERADEAKEIAEEDAAAVTAEDVEALENAEMNARDKAERAEDGKSVPEQDAASVTAEDVAAVKNKEQAKRDRKENAGKKKGAKAVSKAEIGYLYRETMSKLDKEAQNIVSKNFSRDIRSELDMLGYEGDSKQASEAIAKFAMGEIAPETLDILENSKVARDIALSYVGKVDYRNSLYDRAYGIAQRASKDYVKPETTKAEKGTQEATQGIDDRAAISAEDIEVSDVPESTVDGKAVTIEGVASVAEDGSVTYTVKDADGNVSEVSEADVAYGQNDAGIAAVAQNAKELGANADIMLKTYNSEQNAAEYSAAFKQAVQYGDDGRNLDIIKSDNALSALTEQQIEIAYNIGRGVRTNRNNAGVRKNASGVKVGQVDVSDIDFKGLTQHQRTSVHTMGRLAKAAGFNIRFVESKANAEGKYTTENGSWDPETLTLTLDVHAGVNRKDDVSYAMMHTAGHELTHYIRQFADADLWNSYQEFVIGHLSTKEDGVFNLEDRINKQIEGARKKGRDLTRDGAIEEIIANASGEALNSITEADIQALAETNPSLLNKVKQFFARWIKSVKAAIKAAYSNTEAKTPEAKMMMDAVDEMGKRWNELFVNAAKNRASENVASETTIEGVEEYKGKQDGKKYSDRDTEYQDAYDDYDDAKARELVREAATAAGYNSPVLYHGTSAFGFTEIDPAKADDGISFFATTSERVAESYSGESEVRRINSKAKMNPDDLLRADGDTLLELMRKHIDKRYEIVNDAEKKKLIKKEEDSLLEAQEKVREFESDKESVLSGNVEARQAVADIMDALARMRHAETEGQSIRAMLKFDDAFVDLRFADSDLSFELSNSINRDVNAANSNKMKCLHGSVFKIDYGMYEEYAYYNNAIDMLYPKLFRGIYELYGRTDGLLEVDAEGKGWNQLDGEAIDRYGFVRTRDYAEYAKAHGYSGVHFKNIRDTGGQTAYNGFSDVYTFFNPEDVKSADPFTYDDAGNLIPLSQRFDRSKSDIRYSIREADDGRQVVVVDDDILKGIYSGGKWTEEQKEKARDAAKAAISSAGPIYSEGIPFYINARTKKEFPSSKYVWNTLGKTEDELADRFRVSSETENLVLATVGWKDDPLTKNRTDFVRFVKGKVYMEINGHKYEGTVVAGVNSKGKHVLYDLVDMNTANFKMKEEDISSTDQANAATDYSKMSSTEGSIPQNSESGKTQMRDYSELSNRELLVRALETELTPAERDHLERYKTKVDKLGEDQGKLEKLTGRIVELKNAGYTAKTSEELRVAETNATTLRRRIDREDAKLKEIESAAMIKEVIKRNREAARKQAYTLARQRADERQRKAVEHAREVGERRVQRLKESQGKEKYKKRILEDVKKLHTWVASPTNKGSVPEFLREPLAEFIDSIDFSSDRLLKGGDPTQRDIKFTKALDRVREAVSKLNKQYAGLDSGAEAFAGFVDLTGDFAEEFDKLVRNIKDTLDKGSNLTDTPFNRMSAQQLKELSQMFKVLKTSIRQMNMNLANSRYESSRAMSRDGIDELGEMKARTKTNKVLELLNSTFNWKNTTPYYAFERLGRAGKAVFEALQDGWDKMARNSSRVINYAKETFTEQESKAWSSEIDTIELESGETVQMTTAQKMSLYCHTKREQSRGHLMGGGIRMSDIDGKHGSKITQAEDYVLTEDDIANIIDSLTDRQREVADKLQRFMNTVCAEWGNEISMKRFGFEQMTEKNYFPIKTDSNNRASIDEDKDGRTSMFRLLNMSSLKPLTPGANNAIIIEDIFNVFSDHASDMAKYNALALPILDFIKWYNYVERNDIVDESGNPTGKYTTRSTQKSLERVFGKDAKEYLRAFIKDLNAEHDGGRNDGLINNIVGKAKSAAVGANLRVYALQVTSLPRAAYVINPKYLVAGAAKLKSLNPVNAIKGTEAQEKVGILQWKKLGFYSTDINRSTREMIKRNEGWLGKIRDWQMAPAGWGDNWVSNIIYEAAKAEMKDKHSDIREGTAEYEYMLNKRVREIVYKTQVVDSTMTRSDLMRSKGLASMVTAFMAEPTLTVNMLSESIHKAIELGRKGGNAGEILRATGGLAVRAASTWVTASVVTTLMESVFDALRDDDEYEKFYEKFWNALWGDKWYEGNFVQNLNPITMFPILNDAWSIMIEGYEDNSLIMQVFSQFRSFFDAIGSYKKGNTTLYNVIYKGAQTVSSMSGVGAANAARDGVALYNTFLAPAWNTPKAQTYQDSASTAASAYYEALKENRTEDAAYYKRRMEVDGVDQAKVADKVATLIGDDYVAGNITEANARKWFDSETALDAKKIDTKMRDLSFKAETSVNYDDFKSAYLAGTISKTQAQGLLKKYRGYDDNKVYFKLLEWEGGEGWSRYDAFLDAVDAQGNFAAEAKKLLDHGVKKSDIADEIASAYKDAYKQIHGTAEGNRLLEYLLDVYESIGYDRDYERKYITKNWIKD